MSEELSFNDELNTADDAEDFEEICSDEVDRILEALEGLVASTESENIRYFLDEAANRIYELIYDDEETLDEDDLQEAA